MQRSQLNNNIYSYIYQVRSQKIQRKHHATGNKATNQAANIGVFYADHGLHIANMVTKRRNISFKIFTSVKVIR